MRTGRKEREKTGNGGGEHCSSQAHLSNEVLVLVVSKATPALCPPKTHTHTTTNTSHPPPVLAQEQHLM